MILAQQELVNLIYYYHIKIYSFEFFFTLLSCRYLNYSYYIEELIICLLDETKAIEINRYMYGMHFVFLCLLTNYIIIYNESW